ncbi:MAG: hypothetical protein MUC63_03465, partial [Planctomycetes bacterium]|nr:hypothetical protein [Planctomycetota bacterium]
LTAALAGAWVWVRSSNAEALARARKEEEKIDRVKRYFEANYVSLFGDPAGPGNASPLRDRTFIAIVQEVSTECGLGDRVQRVSEEENAKTGEVTAKVAFRGVRIADLVNFLALARKKYPGLSDREARMRQGRGEADSWEVTLSLTAKKP